uniref:Uncharacterized protein n=1 Tax=Cacopsylla melanoneura TaxID=428564 RepID=A0A8D8XJ54_9HEMI
MADLIILNSLIINSRVFTNVFNSRVFTNVFNSRVFTNVFHSRVFTNVIRPRVFTNVFFHSRVFFSHLVLSHRCHGSAEPNPHYISHRIVHFNSLIRIPISFLFIVVVIIIITVFLVVLTILLLGLFPFLVFMFSCFCVSFTAHTFCFQGTLYIFLCIV